MTTTEAHPNQQREPLPISALPAEVDHEIVVVGAGFSGIGLGIKLKEAGFHDFVIIDAADGVGGVWRHNVYPGVAVDIPSTTYSYSFERNPDWSHLFAPGAELRAYAEKCTARHGLESHLRLGTTVASATYDEQQAIWRVDTDRGTVTTRFLIPAVGPLDSPKYPDIPGIDTFAGDIMHTARWNDEIPIDGRRVAVIGTGASALQVVPQIAGRTSHLDVYQRTPIWVIPKPDLAIPRWAQRLFQAFPLAQAPLRWVTSTIAEFIMTAGAVYHTRLPFLVRFIEGVCRRHLESQVADPEIRERLQPTYAFGCKRPSFSSTYLATFNRDNVELVTDRIVRITPTSIVTALTDQATGESTETEHPIDTLILATGFKVMERGAVPAFEVFGIDGVELGEYWDRNRYQNYEGIATPLAPNFWLMNGPWSVAGSSWFSVIESGSDHIIRCLTEARSRAAYRMVVSERAQEEYMGQMYKKVRHTVFAQPSCAHANSYYFDRNGDAPFVRPISGPALRRASRSFNLDDYRYDVVPIGRYQSPLSDR